MALQVLSAVVFFIAGLLGHLGATKLSPSTLGYYMKCIKIVVVLQLLVAVGCVRTFLCVVYFFLFFSLVALIWFFFL